jgi:hypothetical protein
MPVGIEALEPDVGLGVLVLDQLDAFGDHSRSEVSGLLGRIHVEPEVREPRTTRRPSVDPQGQANPSGSPTMTTPSGCVRAEAASNRKYRA